jgi:HEAT repeat protein
LSSLGFRAEAAIPALVAIMEHKTNSQRVMVAQHLANIAIYRQKDVVPVLNECLKDTNTSVRLQATAALKILKREADRAALVKANAQ